ALPGSRLTGGAPRLDLARLELFCRAAELSLGEGRFTVGANPAHARGRALRAAAARRAGGALVSEEEWSAHPQARHWWTTLTARLGVPARLELVRAAPHEEVYRAVVHGPLPSPVAPGPDGVPAPRHPGLPGGPGRVAPGGARPAGPAGVLGEAVEATPGDAAAFATLAAVAAVSAAAGAPAVPADTAEPPLPAAGTVRVPPSGGAVAPLAAAGARIAAWEDTGWTNGWMADVAAREERFQAALHRLTGASLRAPRDPSGGPGPAAIPDPRELAPRLRAFGYAVLDSGPEEAR
ncbi:hypothetical protein ACFVXK_33485, partial [Streptomyces sp. NPDC058157]